MRPLLTNHPMRLYEEEIQRRLARRHRPRALPESSVTRRFVCLKGALLQAWQVVGTLLTAQSVSPVMRASLIAVLTLVTLSGCTVTEASPSPASPIRFVLNDTYTLGDTAHVQIENVGDRTYRYRLSYAACALQYFVDDGRRFIIPPGTHCDMITYGTIRPGETKSLFEWKLDECVKDDWGCVRTKPLSPGTYTITGRFQAENSGNSVSASGSFDLLPSS